MKVCIGIPASFPYFSTVANEIGAEILVSANALRNKRGFRTDLANLFAGQRPRLDSAGFVAMAHYGGYPWSRESYVALASRFPWRWWAARDFCCEPEIAHDRQEVLARIVATVSEYRECVFEAERQETSFPMPVLQGWLPADYELCASLIDHLPSLVGIGSVCRRPVKGLVEIVEHLDCMLPSHVKLHMFGVKSDGISALLGHPRIESTDSMAWDYRAAKVAIQMRRRDPSFVCSLDFRAGFLRDWYLKQTRRAHAAEH